MLCIILSGLILPYLLKVKSASLRLLRYPVFSPIPKTFHRNISCLGTLINFCFVSSVNLHFCCIIIFNRIIPMHQLI